MSKRLYKAVPPIKGWVWIDSPLQNPVYFDSEEWVPAKAPEIIHWWLTKETFSWLEVVLILTGAAIINRIIGNWTGGW